MSQVRETGGGADTTPVRKERNMSGPGTQKTKECGADTPHVPQSRDTQTQNPDISSEEERTFNIEIIGEVNKKNEATNETITSRDEGEITSHRTEEAQDSETEIDMNDIMVVNRIYKKYTKNPKKKQM